MKNKTKLIAVSILVLALIFSLFLFSKNSAEKTSESVLTPVDSVKDIHGIAVDVTDENKLYLGTHYGLVLFENGKFYRVGESETDFMGFNVHPKDPNVFYSSGHPKWGGNVGFQKSDDGGTSWNKISDGVNGPVDFHSITVSPVDPNLIYGWHQTSLQRSLDGGTTWELVRSNVPQVVSLHADTEDENKLYAVTVAGILKSEDRGERWNPVFTEFTENVPTALAVNPKDSKKIMLFTRKDGLLLTSDGGENWDVIDEDFGGDVVIYFAHSPQNPNKVYTATHKYGIYSSSDGGKTWKIN